LKGLCHITDEALLARLGLRRHSLVLSKGFQKCAFRNSIWRIVPSKIVIFIRQMASCLHRQLAKYKFPIAMASKIATFRALGFPALIPWFSTGSTVSLIPSFITYP
jgi:hypothetical protein